MKRGFYFTIVFTILFFPILALADNVRVTFINPGHPDTFNSTGGFWTNVSKFMEAAAEDLNINLEILYSSRNHLKMQEHASEVISRKEPPDYLLIVNEKLSAEEMVIKANKKGVKIFVMLNRFEGEQHQRMGQPREKYKNWIGSLVPDNHFAGYQIAKYLIEHAQKHNRFSVNSHLEIVGFAGDYVTPASVQRVEGLKKAVSDYPNVDLKQVVATDWSRDIARRKAPHLLKRYPKIGAIWAANDPIAIGAMEGVMKAGIKPGKDIFFGGLNWDTPGLEKINNGDMVTSLGGHFMTGGWVLVLLHDYHFGRDFAEEGVRLQYKIFGAIHHGNIDFFVEKFGDKNWGKIDFTNFSKVINPSINKYNFTLEALLGG